jgi:hypothetical protein
MKMIFFWLWFLDENLFQFAVISTMPVSHLASEINTIIEELPMMDSDLVFCST